MKARAATSKKVKSNVVKVSYKRLELSCLKGRTGGTYSDRGK